MRLAYVTLPEIGAASGNVSQVALEVSQWYPKLVAVDKEANDDVMHLYRLGEADRLASQSLNPRT